MEKEVYLIIDEFLKALEKEEFGMRLPVKINRSWPKGKAVIELMMKYELADFKGNDISTIDIVSKNLNGKKILDAGGFESWLNTNKLKSDTKEILELKKLELDVKNAGRIYDTYWWTFGFAVGGFVIAIISLLLQLRK